MKSPIEPLARRTNPATPLVADVTFQVLPPLSALLEIAIIFGVIVGADWLHPGIDITDIRPHPFWVPVLLLSLQYGTVSGLLAASVAIALTALNGFAEQSTSETYFAYFLKIWIEPILWVGAAVLLGQFRMRQIAHKQALFVQVTELANQRATLADYARNLRAHSTALERQIAARREPDIQVVLAALQSLRQSAASADHHDGRNGVRDQHFVEAVQHVIGLAIPNARSSLYAVDATGMRRISVGPPFGDATKGAWIGPTEHLFRAIVGDGRSISVLTADGEQILAGAGVAAVAIRAHSRHGSDTTARVIGMIKIDEIDPASLGPALLPSLETIAGVVAPALEALHGRTGIVGVALTSQPNEKAEASSQRIWRHLRWFNRDPTAAPGKPDSTMAAAKSQVTR